MYGIKIYIFVIVALPQDKLSEINVYVLEEEHGLELNVFAQLEHSDQIVFHAQLLDSGMVMNVFVKKTEYGTDKNRVWNGQDCVCAAGLFGPNCVPCPAPRSWDNNSQQCVCPQNRVWNGQDCVCAAGLYGPNCEPCPAPRQWLNNRCDCQAPLVWNGNT